ncbi:hypothetical protein JCM5353_003277 [Sporobolomyces roseus]
MSAQPKGRHPAHDKLFPKRKPRSPSPSPVLDTDPQTGSPDPLTKARAAADDRLEKNHDTAHKKLEDLNILLKIIVGECKVRGENEASLKKWKSDYMNSIRGTSMSEIVLEGFEKHLHLVKRRVPKEEATIDEIWLYELEFHLDRLEIHVDRQIKENRAPYQAGPSDELRRYAHHYFQDLKDGRNLLRRKSSRKQRLKTYREIFVLEELVHSGQAVIEDGAPAYFFEVVDVLDRIDKWTVRIPLLRPLSGVVLD